jgi:hypothetical protein
MPENFPTTVGVTAMPDAQPQRLWLYRPTFSPPFPARFFPVAVQYPSRSSPLSPSLFKHPQLGIGVSLSWKLFKVGLQRHLGLLAQFRLDLALIPSFSFHYLRLPEPIHFVPFCTYAPLVFFPSLTSSPSHHCALYRYEGTSSKTQPKRDHMNYYRRHQK